MDIATDMDAPRARLNSLRTKSHPVNEFITQLKALDNEIKKLLLLLQQLIQNLQQS